ncbi:TIGR01777 family oxidoreductase [Emticicia fluvialis]|uniref:TIGR01777 family oxidoreductase n=1 Tax=Emticicia fluvialis TaxID=2974474 RepID=UPI0021659C5B|nr:TIGR01777 family oxidoreductase [Emticicia fluvialis]
MKILITGGTGLIGRRLTLLLQKKGHQVVYLSRKKENIKDVIVYKWDISAGYIEPEALENIDYIVHLAGAGIADKRWTEERKQEIIDSRIEPIVLLKKHLQEKNISIKGFISASGISCYGTDTGETRLDEHSLFGDDFLAYCCELWEEETRNFTPARRTASIRTGVVLSREGGALPKMMLPVKWGVGSPFGDGRQWMSWIHIDDICQLYLQCIEDENITGPFNAVAPAPIRNAAFVATAAKVLKRPFWAPAVPAFVLKLLLGEMSAVLLGGNYIINKRMAEELSFNYQYPELETALQDLLK